MNKTSAEYAVTQESCGFTLRFKKRSGDLARYFSDFTVPEPITEAVLKQLISQANSKAGGTVTVGASEIDNTDITLSVAADSSALEPFIDAFLDALEAFYEAHEAHVTRMFGSFIYLERTDGELRAVRATPVPIRYCPLMKQLLKDVGGETAAKLLSSVEAGDNETQTEKMCSLINEVVIKGGYFDTARALNSCEANVLFGASETMSTAFRSGLLDAAVIVSNNLGTIITIQNTVIHPLTRRMKTGSDCTDASVSSSEAWTRHAHLGRMRTSLTVRLQAPERSGR
jgi:hypothetical protein